MAEFQPTSYFGSTVTSLKAGNAPLTAGLPQGKYLAYGGFQVETSLAEVRFHMTQMLEATGVFAATVDYAELHASFAGDFLDLREHPQHPVVPDRA